MDLKEETESQFNTAGSSEFQVRGAAVLNDRLANDVRRNSMHSSGTDGDRVLRVLVHSDGSYLFIYYIFRHIQQTSFHARINTRLF